MIYISKSQYCLTHPKYLLIQLDPSQVVLVIMVKLIMTMRNPLDGIS